MSIEWTVIKNLAELFPGLSERLMDIHDNMHDLIIPFKDQDYYSKAMQAENRWLIFSKMVFTTAI